MTAKATIQDVLNEGFQSIMFGSPADFAATGGVIDTLLMRASNWAASKVGTANYTATIDPSYAFDCLVRAETAYASQALWIRRTGFLDASVTVGLDAMNKAALLSQARKSADAAEADATFWIGEAQRALGVGVQADLYGTGVSSGRVETGQYPQVDHAALNYGGAQ